MSTDITFAPSKKIELFMKLVSSFIVMLIALNVVGQSKNYFQQEVNYKIKVTLDDQNHMLYGDEEFEYINNSNDVLTEIFIHLWPNAYKNAKTAMAKQQFAKGDYFLLWAGQKDRGYIDSLNFAVDDQKVDFVYPENYEDIAVIKLPKPLQPGGKITVTTPFRVKIPSGTISRLGHIGQSYQITQWYPKPAVYDREGWHEMPYLTQGEFYSEFGSFDVEITLPENYTVGATGDLQTESEMQRLEQLASAPVLPSKGSDNTFPPSSEKTKTLRYVQNNVHDFGWFADKRWIVRKGEVELPHSKRKVTTWAMFTPESADLWLKTGIKSINDGLYYYSLWTGDYPYNQCTAVDGTISAGGGMEYPNVTVIGNTSSEQGLATVIIHEVGHNWFYGILGSNERDNAWMDEGINSFFETRTILKTNPNPSRLGAMVGNEKVDDVLKLDRFSYQYITEELSYLLSARTNEDQPMQLPSEYYSNMNYGTIVYKKSALAFNYLMNYLGEEEFNRCMAAYYEAWKFKHPSPADLQSVFETTSGKNLSWFFDDLVTTRGKLDYATAGTSKTDNGYQIKVKNTGDIPGPFSIDVVRKGLTVSNSWFDGIEPGSKKKIDVAAEKGDLIKVNAVTGIPEFDRKNNTAKTSGLMRNKAPLKIGKLTSIDNPDYKQAFWFPIVGWNDYNKWMAGIHFHNQTIPSRKFRWSIAPMYSIAANNVNGFASIGIEDGIFNYGIRAQKFSDSTTKDREGNATTSYTMISPSVEVKLFANRGKKDWSGKLNASWFILGRRFKNADSETLGNEIGYDPNKLYAGGALNHMRVQLNAKKMFLRSELRITSTVEAGEFTDYGLFQQQRISYDYIYRGKGKKKIRASAYYGSGSGFKLNAAGQTGSNDYLYDGLFFGRSATEGLLSQQFLRTQGGLALPTQFGADKGLFSLNLEVDAPIRFPIGIYGGIALLNNSAVLCPNNGDPCPANPPKQIFNAGVSLPLIRGIFEVYIPVIYSQDVVDEFKRRDMSFGETIMFQLNLDLMNPFYMLRNVSL